MAFVLHNYRSYEHWFPAIEAELADYLFNIGNLAMFLSSRVLIGMQQKDQVFKTSSPGFLGLFGLCADFFISKHFLPYIDFTAKADGWVAGNEYLDSNVSVKIGISAQF
jgi:hypothetical protein